MARALASAFGSFSIVPPTAALSRSAAMSASTQAAAGMQCAVVVATRSPRAASIPSRQRCGIRLPAGPRITRTWPCAPTSAGTFGSAAVWQNSNSTSG